MAPGSPGELTTTISTEATLCANKTRQFLRIIYKADTYQCHLFSSRVNLLRLLPSKKEAPKLSSLKIETKRLRNHSIETVQ